MDTPVSVAAGATQNNQRTSTKNPSQLTSPARSDRSDDSEGRPVREKLQETRIDTNPDHTMNDAATNGRAGETSTSGSDNERGRLRRKRSREDFEDEAGDAKHPGKKHERHTRKKSRDEVTSPVGSDREAQLKKATTSVASIPENMDDGNMEPPTSATDRQATPEAVASDKEGGAIASPKNKRKLEQTTPGNDSTAEPSQTASASAKGEERDTKRSKDGTESAPAATEPKTTIPAGSGFANTSTQSPFASVALKSTVKATDASAKDLPQTSSAAFKSSGFGAFASATASPFATSAKSNTGSPFGAATGTKVSSFASKPASSSSTPSGFAGLGGATSSFSSGLGAGRSTFGGALGGSAFGSVLGGKPALSTFGGGGSITGLKQKTAPEFGAAETKADSDNEGDEDGDDDDDNEDGEKDSDKRSSQPLLSTSGPLETGEENEDARWTGRAKLYAFVNQDGNKSWQERGKGQLKLNTTREEPKKARFVLRADGTHRLLLNAAITTHMKIGDGDGNEPTDGRLTFTAPTITGEVELLMLFLGQARAADLWQEVDALKKSGTYT